MLKEDDEAERECARLMLDRHEAGQNKKILESYPFAFLKTN